MGHHINDAGNFQSDKHPDLPENRIRLNLENPRSVRALMVLSADYEDEDVELASDLRRVLAKLHPTAYAAGTFCRVMDSNGKFYGQPGLITGVEAKQDVEGSMVLRIVCHVATPRGHRKIDAQQLLPGMIGWQVQYEAPDPENPEAPQKVRPVRLRLPIQVHPMGEINTSTGEASKYMAELQSGLGTFQALGGDEPAAIKAVIEQVIAKLPDGLPEGVSLVA